MKLKIMSEEKYRDEELRKKIITEKVELDQFNKKPKGKD